MSARQRHRGRQALIAVFLVASICSWGCRTTCISGCGSTVAQSVGEPLQPESAAAATPTEAEPLTNTLRWKTASEVDNFGFDVFRGPSEDGPFERLNEEPIQGAGTTDEPQFYSFVDATIEAGVEYWYYVESISMSGEREQFTPIFKSKAKYPGDG